MNLETNHGVSRLSAILPSALKEKLLPLLMTTLVPSHYEDDPWLVADDHLRGRFMAGWGWSVPSHCEEMIHGRSGMVTCARRPTLILDLERGIWPTMPEDAEELFGNVIIRGLKK
ncbi:uncharacterized protein LOC119300224 [Triticum dicoccoides]|uniref:uncharacterized protein LOC119300224 n=1 Tax=Triticum dicoccoides TaxID=85692 RepID=UPI00188DDE79|nr:uncharacterized protein LOC119300224 [Triticum dicoccoides]